MQRTIKIRDLNAHIVCSLCAGYYINATTITECLHTFCRSCIVKFLQTKRCCPQCGSKVHETQPLSSLRADRVLQDIVYKLIPGLHEEERKRVEEFAGIQKKTSKAVSETSTTTPLHLDHLNHFFTSDPPLSFCLQEFVDEAQSKKHSFKLRSRLVRASERTIMAEVKKLILHHLLDPIKSDPLKSDPPISHDLANSEKATYNNNSKNNNKNTYNNNEQTDQSIKATNRDPIREQHSNATPTGQPMAVELFDSNLRGVADLVTLRQLWLRRLPISENPIQLHYRFIL